MSEEKPRLSRRELREQGLLAPITEGPSPLDERRKRESAGPRSSRRARAAEGVIERDSEQGGSSVFDRFVSDDDEAPVEAAESPEVSEAESVVDLDDQADDRDDNEGDRTEPGSLEERLLARVREDDFASSEGTDKVSTPGESRAVEVADAVVDAEIIKTEYDLDERAEPKRPSILMLLIFIIVGIAIGLLAGVGYRSFGAPIDGEISPKFSVAVLQTVDSLQEENSVSI